MVKRSTKPTSFAVSARLQRLFVGLLFGIVLIETLISAYYAVVQFPTNPNLSAFFVPFLQALVWPVFVFLVPFLAGIRRRMPLLNRVFEAAFFAVIGILCLILLSSIVQFVQTIPRLSFDSYGGYILIMLVQMLVLGSVYAIAVTRYQKNRT